jgi:late competence protein required for DNA uptake (superfamily II DNA/RNA helicase)
MNAQDSNTVVSVATSNNSCTCVRCGNVNHFSTFSEFLIEESGYPDFYYEICSECSVILDGLEGDEWYTQFSKVTKQHEEDMIGWKCGDKTVGDADYVGPGWDPHPRDLSPCLN